MDMEWAAFFAGQWHLYSENETSTPPQYVDHAKAKTLLNLVHDVMKKREPMKVTYERLAKISRAVGQEDEALDYETRARALKGSD